MITLSSDLAACLEAGERLVVPDARRAAAVRLAWAHMQVARGCGVWNTPDVATWTGWLEDEWAAASAAGARTRVMGANEAWVVWRACAIETAQELSIEPSDALMGALHRAAQLAAHWRIPVEAIVRGGRIECTWLARTLRAFDARGRALGAAPVEQIASQIERCRTSAVNVAGAAALTPAQRLLLDAWKERGSDIRLLGSEHLATPVALARARDSADELGWAAQWARAHLVADPRRRLLIVLRALPSARASVVRAFAEQLPAASSDEAAAFAMEGGEPIASIPLVRHAIGSLRFLLAPLDFEACSAWLRAPHWEHPAPATRSRLDLWLRTHVGVRVSWKELATAFAHAPRELEAAAGELLARMNRFATAAGGAHARSSIWAERFAAALTELGWPGRRSGGELPRAYVRFREVLNELASFAVTLGDLDQREALNWLERLLARTSFDEPAPDPAITITDSLDDPLVQYDGIWVSDLSASSWPRPAQPDPFIPVHAQLAAGWPAASPAGQLTRARAALALWRQRAGELVLSWPSSAEDCRQTASVLLHELDGAEPLPRESRVLTPASVLFNTREIELYDDIAGEPWPLPAIVPGGSRSVEHQIRCAFRAYAELRLRAAPLERPRPGLDPRVRGQLLHRALERLWGEVRDSSRLAAMRGGPLEDAIAASVASAVEELSDEERGEARDRALARERRRLVRVMGELCALEAKRAPFSVMEREARYTVSLDGIRLKTRIDRIDRLEEGGLALIDYKSGNAQPYDWLDDRPAHAQLLVYGRALPARDIAALSFAHLSAGNVRFRGIADQAGRLPGVHALEAVQATEEGGAWERQLEHWNRVVDDALRDFAAGDARRDPAPGACTQCHLHALCRIADAAGYPVTSHE